ncbi:hypothetical protein GB937_009254 [Aspergillus fischeri]|nr:hypothetical protein GB937_009254 [Aspergillus fischeri]
MTRELSPNVTTKCIYSMRLPQQKARKEYITCVRAPAGRVGLLICFDLCLDLFRSDGTCTLGDATPTRAIETQCYVIAAAQAGPHYKERTSYYHSMIVNPWGEVVATLGDEHKGPQIATAEIDFEFFSRVRRKIKLPRGVDIHSEI